MFHVHQLAKLCSSAVDVVSVAEVVVVLVIMAVLVANAAVVVEQRC